MLSLGTVASADVTYLNGVWLGGSGDAGDAPAFCGDAGAWRAYAVRGALRAGRNVVAVKVWSAGGDESPGGLFDDGMADGRIGALDAAASEGGVATGFAVGGFGWYRKAFATPPAAARTLVRFDGVYERATVWCNGALAATRPYGYTTFHVDLTPHLTTDGVTPNVLAVRVDNTGVNSRWSVGRLRRARRDRPRRHRGLARARLAAATLRRDAARPLPGVGRVLPGRVSPGWNLPRGCMCKMRTASRRAAPVVSYPVSLPPRPSGTRARASTATSTSSRRPQCTSRRSASSSRRPPCRPLARPRRSSRP